MKHYHGVSGWVSATVPPPKPGSIGYKVAVAGFTLHRRIFQLTRGRVAGTLDGAPLLVLHHTGAKTGVRRQNLTVQMPDGENFVIVGSAAGGPKHPAWYHNVRAHPDDVEIDVRGGHRKVRAREATPAEVARLWPRLLRTYPPFETYTTRTDRGLPVIILEPR